MEIYEEVQDKTCNSVPPRIIAKYLKLITSKYRAVTEFKGFWLAHPVDQNGWQTQIIYGRLWTLSTLHLVENKVISSQELHINMYFCFCTFESLTGSKQLVVPPLKVGTLSLSSHSVSGFRKELDTFVRVWTGWKTNLTSLFVLKVL